MSTFLRGAYSAISTGKNKNNLIRNAACKLLLAEAGSVNGWGFKYSMESTSYQMACLASC